MNRLILLFFLAISSLSVLSQQFNWIGSINNDWFEGNNWDTGFPPGSSTDHVTIQPTAQNWPIITSTVTCGDLILMNNTFLNVSTGTIEVFGNVMSQGNIAIGTGNFISNSSFDGTGGTIDFTDNGELTIKHESVASFGDLDANFGTVNYHAFGLPQSIEESEIFANLKIDNAEGLQLNFSIEVNKAVDFANGLIYSSSSNFLKMNAFSYVAAVSNTSHVFGEMKKETNSTAPFTFPIGDNDNYMGLTITPATSNPSTYTAKYETNAHSSSSTLYPTNGLDHVSELYWWNLQGPNCDVGLNWNANSLVDDHNSIVLAIYNVFNAQWEVVGNSLTSSNGGGSSTNSDGRVSSQTGSLGMGDFTLGSISSLPNNPFVHISNLPVADFSASQANVCVGNSVSFTDLTTNSPTSWIWNFGDGSSSNLQNPTHTYLNPGTYTVSLTATNANGSNTETKSDYITVYPDPVVSLITPTDIICFGANNGSIDLSVSGGTSPYTFSWSNFETTEDISNLSDGTYTVTITDDNSCTADTFAIVNEPTAISISETIVNATCNASCDGSITLSVTGGNPSYSFLWNPGGETTQNIANLCAGTYSVELTDGNGCTANSSYTITEPAPVTVNAGSDITICDGNSVTLSGSGANSYSWDNGITDGVAFIPGLGITTYTVTGTDADGCSNTDDIVVTVNALPNVNAGSDNTICDGNSVTLSGSGANSYSWDNGLGAGQSHSVSPSFITTYTVTGTDADGCSNTDDIVVTVNALPNVNAGSDITICDGNSVTLSGSGANSYSWDNGITDGVAFIPGLGITTYTVTGTDANGCSNTDQVDVIVNALPM